MQATATTHIAEWSLRGFDRVLEPLRYRSPPNVTAYAGAAAKEELLHYHKGKPDTL